MESCAQANVQKLLVIGAAQSVYSLDQRSGMFRVYFRVNAMAEVEDMTIALAKTIKDAGDFVTNLLR